MGYLLCKKNNINCYVTVNEENGPLTTLYLFFTDSLGLSDFNSWLENVAEDETGTNTCILKKVDNLIEVSLNVNIWGVENPILLTRENFSKVIAQWNKLCREGWDEIMIMKDDNGVHLEGKNSE